MASKEPEFSVVNRVGGFEIRNYYPMIIAEVSVGGTMEAASSSGFRMLADFIFGNNTSQSGKSEKIDMTVPVGISKNEDAWFFHFVMPSKQSLKSLPKPNNPEINIRQLGTRRCAVLKFSGTVTEEKFNSKAEALISLIKSENLEIIGLPELARYNPPWTLPFLRRNEIIIEIN